MTYAHPAGRRVRFLDSSAPLLSAFPRSVSLAPVESVLSRSRSKEQNR